MHRTLPLVAALTLFVPGPSPTPDRPQDEKAAKPHPEIERLLRGMERAFGAGDMNAVAAYYADDAVLLGPDGYRVAGRAAIDGYWARMTNPVRWKLESRSVEGERGIFVNRGRSTLVRTRDGEPRTSVVEFVLIWTRQKDGKLRIAMDAYWG